MTARCHFPDCPNHGVTERGMCQLHKRVTVSGSWVPDAHTRTEAMDT